MGCDCVPCGWDFGEQQRQVMQGAHLHEAPVEPFRREVVACLQAWRYAGLVDMLDLVAFGF
jgi:hypothetical protein